MRADLFDFYLFPLSDWRQLEKRISGNNGRRVLVVLELIKDDAELMDFLEKIFSAVKLNLQEDTLLFKLTTGENISFSSLAQAHAIESVLLFGIQPARLGLHFTLPLNEPVRFGDVSFLSTSSLAALFEERNAGARPKAAALWKNLKQLFTDPNTP
ncbi:MAG: hypothetical protein KDD06_01295 [Phaeodactylibacter sp.]|nr:hypothetical protein [Phaeodactylibacter sp.]MCB9288730.1 hypothetical protein [Lewinellaceae bacterium]